MIEQDLEQLRFIFIEGKPAIGKDTQADLLVEKIPSSIKISTGDIVRGAKTPTGEYGRFYSIFKPFFEEVDSGLLLPDDLILYAMDQVIHDHIDAKKRDFLLTGFPRTINQLEAVDKWLSILAADFRLKTDFIWYDAKDILVKKRVKVRRDRSKAQGLPIREDDKPQVVKERLSQYHQNTRPLLEKLHSGKRVFIINADKDITSIHHQTLRVLRIPITTTPSG